MAIIKQTEPYELLVRFNKTGIQGMHVQNIEKVFDDVTQEVYSEKTLGAQKVEEATAEYQEIILSINAAIQTENDNLKASNIDLQTQVTSLESEKINLQSQIAYLQAQINKL